MPKRLRCTLLPLPYQSDPSPLFARIATAPDAVLLDSAQRHSHLGRYDLLSAWPLAQFSPNPEEAPQDFLARLRSALATLGKADLPTGCELPFAGGLIGWLSYDFGRDLQSLPKRPQSLPLAQMGLYAWALITDHQHKQTCLLFHPKCPAAEQKRISTLFTASESPTSNATFRLLAPFTADMPKAQYQSAFSAIQRYIEAGDCYQVNLTQSWHAPCVGEAWTAYQALRRICPTPFAGFIRLAEQSAILSLSPERFLRISQRTVETRPIKGTKPRANNPQEDARLAAELLASPKDRAENLMIVDLLRNDLSRTCQHVQVPQLFALESYPNVHHLVSQITAQLAEDKDSLDVLAASFPGGSITGAPKLRAMQIIDELEARPRGIYCGSLLYLDVRGELDSSIAIRTLLQQDGQMVCAGGGGITAGSEGEAEYQESIEKVRILIETLQQI